jgi:hypothetical protein
MPRPRQRYDDAGAPRPLRVTLDSTLAGMLYDACDSLAYKDETDLVSEIVRQWLQSNVRFRGLNLTAAGVLSAPATV